MLKITQVPFLKSNYTSTDIILSCVLSVVILITSSYGIYIAKKGGKSPDMQWHLPVVKFLAVYWGMNIFRVLYILPSLFIDISRVFEVIVWYNQINYITQQYLILVIALCCVITSFQARYTVPNSLKRYAIPFVVLAVFLYLLGFCYVLLTDALNIEIAWKIANYSLLIINFVAFIASLGVVVIYYFWHQKENLAEKCYRMSYAFVPFIMSIAFIVKHLIVIFSNGTVSYNGFNNHFTIIYEILTLLSSFGTFLVIRKQNPVANIISDALPPKLPTGPLME